MEEKVVDRRVRKTKRQLRLALMKLMAEKSVKDISVRELAAIADINRGTFYIHYKDVYDLLSSLEDELADGLVVVCRRHNAKDSEGKTYPYLMELYQYIEQNSDLCHVLLGKNGDIAFTDRICHILRDEFCTTSSRITIRTTPRCSTTSARSSCRAICPSRSRGSTTA